MGTVNVLDAVRAHGDGVRAVVNVTSDKCYENREWEWGYREDEPMGGHDPVLELQGLRRARHRRLPALLLLASRDGAARRLGPRRQRDRRRRLGARTGWCPTSCAPRSPASRCACATPTRSAPGSTCSTRSAATWCSPRRCGTSPELRRRLELRPRRRGRPPGRLDRRAHGRAVGRRSSRWAVRRRSASPRGALSEARLLARARRASAGVRWSGLDAGSGRDRRLVPGAARRRGHARRHRSDRSRRSSTLAAAP